MNYLEKARRIIALEIMELQSMEQRLNTAFSHAVDLLRAALDQGRKLVVCGVGKSGSIGGKLAATLNSTGAPSVLLNVGDALHGDLGVIHDEDVIITLSHSGETQELVDLLPHFKRRRARIIALTGRPHSLLAQQADVVLDVAVSREACPLNLAPTSSTTCMLVMGDALAMVLLEARGFAAEDFARLHPGGTLGRALLTRVRDVMRHGPQLASVPLTATVRQALQAMTTARSGATVVCDSHGTLAGVFTHGDFVRAFQHNADLASTPVSSLMTPHPITVHADKLAMEVLAILDQHRVDDLVVIDDDRHPVGLVDTQDLSRLRLI
ncbi:MAG: KpsF/GutQ family sugar-phosphate isomerase [Verrucomicrobiales bacterium]|nr:KpsF/GutQ family sugar-phosphate isomerase [Verrucomicrobiales bacterium]